MTYEIRELRLRWQNRRDTLRRADYNHADEELARTIHFADSTSVISGVINSLRQLKAYDSFDASAWLENMPTANTFGARRKGLGLSLDDAERAAQCLRLLELSITITDQGGDGLFILGQKTYGGSSSGLVAYAQSAVEAIFMPFYDYVDAQLRSSESLISPADIMRDMQRLVDNQASVRYPDAHKLLQDAYQQMFTLKANDSEASWNLVAYACRHALIQLGKDVFKPEFVPAGEKQPKDDDADEKLKWTARYHLRQQGQEGRYRDGLEKILVANWIFVNTVAHRQESDTEDDARLALIYTYLTVQLIDHIIGK